MSEFLATKPPTEQPKKPPDIMPMHRRMKDRRWNQNHSLRVCCVSVANDRLAVCIQCPVECSQAGINIVVENVLDCSRKRSNIVYIP